MHTVVTPADVRSLGRSSSIGTLPHDDPVDAVRFVLDRQSSLPAVPQLPNRSPLERRIPQAAWGIAGVAVASDGTLVVHPDRVDPEAPFGDPTFLGAPYATLRTFLDAAATRVGPAKFQLTGPVTLGLALAAAGVPGPVAFAAADTVVRSRAAALLELIAARAPRVQPVVLVDEPGLRGCLDPAFPVAADDALDLVSGVLAALEPHALAGLRCTDGRRGRDPDAAAMDWPLVLQTGPQLLAVPVPEDRTLVTIGAAALAGFLERGGVVAWGAVPTEGPVGESVAPLRRSLSTLWSELVVLGCDLDRLRAQALVTPAGGLGRHTVGQAAATFALVDELAAAVRVGG